MMFSFFYNLSLFFLFVLSAPRFFFQKFFKGKYSRYFFTRLVPEFPFEEVKNKYVIWVHAVSVGETKAIAALVRDLKKKIQNPYIIISSVTETGHAEAKRTLGCANTHIFLPFDFSPVIRPFVKKIRPDLVLISETDLWYNFLSCSKEEGAKIVLVNGKISGKSTKRLKRFPFFASKIFSLFDLLCIQSENYLFRFQSTGISTEKMFVTGNLKLDDDYPEIKPEEIDAWKKELGISPDDAVIVIGSTHHPEEEKIINKLQVLWKKNPALKMIVVPRHPERFDSVAKLLEDLKIPFTRFSALKNKQGNENVILIDAMGLLRKCYRFADIAIVGGSFCEKVGGHNILEPCWYGVPTLFGPHMYNQPEMVDMVKRYNAGIQVSLDDLPRVIERLIKNKGEKELLGKGGVRLVFHSKGATKKTSDHILGPHFQTTEKRSEALI